jgi:deoxyribodipyrimidine photo-lyase
MKERINILWLKRDLRLHDHGPFEYCSNKSEENPNFKTLILYVEEEGYWRSDKASTEQREFVRECLDNLQPKIQKLGNKLIWIQSEENCVQVFEKLIGYYEVESILTHRESGNKWTFDRDIQINKLLKSHKVKLIEFKQDCLTRGSETYETGNKNFPYKYTEFNSKIQYKVPTYVRGPNNYPKWLTAAELSTRDFQTADKTEIQRGGEDIAISYLTTFLQERCLEGNGYRSEMSNPLGGRLACSRISPHLTWGSLSSRAALQTCTNALQNMQKFDRRRNHLSSFQTRLAWRSHFMQKFETLHWMEFKCINKNTENLHEWDEGLYQRWASGMTGYPFVDACMRSLNETKWLNFRARALLVSFASYALNLDWRGFGPHLARNFLDYEPGIHYNQLQMQGGTTIGSPPRIYNPIKQSIEKDPKGDFIRRWVPELKDIKNSLIHIPADSIRNGYPKASVPPSALWATMRSHAPRKTRNQIGNKRLNQTKRDNQKNFVQTELLLST